MGGMGTQVVGSDGAASVLGSPSSGPIPLPVRASADDVGPPSDLRGAGGPGEPA
jgi:hypothetical protein